MILAACGGRGNGEKGAEGLARAESGEWEVGRVDRKEGVWGGVDGNGEGKMGRGAIGTGRGWQWGGGQHEEEMEREAVGKRGGRWEGRNRKGGKGKEVGRGRGRGRRRGKRRGDFTDGYDGMPGWT